MARIGKRARRGFYAVTVALGFGSGSAQAPIPTACGEGDGARACNPAGCNRSCQAQGSISGSCTETGLCRCAF